MSRAGYWLGLCAVALGCDGEDPSAYCTTCTIDRVAPAAPAHAENCGDTGYALPTREFNACIQAALDEGRAFTATAHPRGIDSLIEIRYLGLGDGSVLVIERDSDVCGGAGCDGKHCGPRIESFICSGPTIAETDPALLTQDGGLSRWSPDPIRCMATRDSRTLCGPPN